MALGCALLAGLVWLVVEKQGGSGTEDVSTGVDATPSLSAGDSSDPSPEPATPARRATSVVVPEPPATVTLPSGAVVPVEAVATRSDGLLDVPRDIDTAGWWEGGSRIGDPFGSTLVAAHIDSSTQGLGPFAELLSVEPDERVVLTSEKLTQDFQVESLRLVPQGSLVGEPTISSADGKRRLTLVTCAPPYDSANGGYQNLAVVTAVPVGAPEETL